MIFVLQMSTNDCTKEHIGKNVQDNQIMEFKIKIP